MGSLKIGVSNRSISAAKKARVDDDTVRIMKNIEMNYGDLNGKVKSLKTKKYEMMFNDFKEKN